MEGIAEVLWLQEGIFTKVPPELMDRLHHYAA